MGTGLPLPVLRMQSLMPRIRYPEFYVDECLDSNNFIEILQDTGIQVVKHRDIFGNDIIG